MLTIRTMNLNNPRARLRNCALAVAALIALTIAALIPTRADAHNFRIDKPEDLLEELIELDADEIAELREDLIEAQDDINDAIFDIEDAKKDIRDVPAGGAIARVAFKAASAAVDGAAGRAIGKAQKTLEEAESLLSERRDEVGEAEYKETKDAIIMIRRELAQIEDSLDDLLAAMRED